MVAKILALLLLCIACSEKEVVYTKEQMMAMGPKDSTDKVELLLARNINDVIPCSNYGEGCLSVHRLQARKLEFIAVEFATSAEAIVGSKKIRGWRVKNWLFDDVEGEPELMDWIQKYYQAERFKPLEKAGESAGKSAGSAAPSPATAQ